MSSTVTDVVVVVAGWSTSNPPILCNSVTLSFISSILFSTEVEDPPPTVKVIACSGC